MSEPRQDRGLGDVVEALIRRAEPANAEPDVLEAMFGPGALTNALMSVTRHSETARRVAADLAVDLLYEAFVDGPDGHSRLSGASSRLRALNVAGRRYGAPAALVFLDPDIPAGEGKVLAPSFHLPDAAIARLRGAVEAASHRLDGRDDNPRARLLWILPSLSDAAIRDLIRLGAPRIVVTRAPRMERASAPTPHLKVVAGSASSTAGVYCTDAQGQAGVTACHHGTGPVGTAVTVNGIATQVTRASEVQDLVFLPLNSPLPLAGRTGNMGVRGQRLPAQADPAAFEGGASGKTSTLVASHDAGLLRHRPTVQLKVQTRADTNAGDSGSALIDEHDYVMGFAFERTAINDFPEFTDWIWADNALRTLGLTPI